MDPFTIALLGGSAISGLSSYFGGSKARKEMEAAAAQAAAAQRRAYQQAEGALTTGYDRSMGYYNPLMESGDAARLEYERSIGLHGQDAERDWINGMVRDPGYMAGLSEGQRAIDASAAARGMRMSGQTLKALQQHGHRYLTDAMDKRRAAYNPLMQTGVNATDAAGRLAYGYGGDLSRLYTGKGQDEANMYLGMGQMKAQGAAAPFNALSGTIQSGLTAYGYGQGRMGPR